MSAMLWGLFASLFVCCVFAADSFPADPSEPSVRAAADFAAEHILAQEGWTGNLNVIFTASRKVFDGFLYSIHLELITEHELIHYNVEVFKDMGQGLEVKSYKLGDRRRWRPDLQLSQKQKAKLKKKLYPKDEL